MKYCKRQSIKSDFFFWKVAIITNNYECLVGMSISSFQLVSIKVFKILDIGYEHEYSNPFEMDRSYGFI